MNREALLVLGMHRSGTSAVAGLLVRLGATAPATLMPADEANSEGYWESSVLCQFHDRLLAEAGSRWDSYTRLDPQWFQSPAARALEAECRALLRTEFGDAPRFVVKDPRVCRFVPFWLRVLDAEAVAPSAVLVLRDPGEVARSLEARNGFGHDLSLLIWLRHVLDAEHATRTVRRTLVEYRDVLDDWRHAVAGMSSDLGGGWPTAPATDSTEAGESLKPDLRHHSQGFSDSGDGTLLTEWVRRAWTALEWLQTRELARTAEAHQTLDAVREDLDRTTAVFGGVTERRISGLQARMDALRQDVQRLVAEGAALHSELASARSATSAAQARLSAAEQEVQALRSSMSWRVTAPLRAMRRMVD